MPLPIDDGIFLTVDSPYDTIAISHDARKYCLTTITDLAADCFRLGNFYACPRGNNALRAPLDTGERNTMTQPFACGLYSEDGETPRERLAGKAWTIRVRQWYKYPQGDS